MRQKKGLVLVIMFRFISTSESTESQQVIEAGVKNESKQMAKTRKLAGIVNYDNGPLYLFFFFFCTLTNIPINETHILFLEISLFGYISLFPMFFLFSHVPLSVSYTELNMPL